MDALVDLTKIPRAQLVLLAMAGQSEAAALLAQDGTAEAKSWNPDLHPRMGHWEGNDGWFAESLESSDRHLAERFGEPVLRSSGREEQHPKTGWPIKVGRHRRLLIPTDGETPARYTVDDHGELDSGKLFPDKNVAEEPIGHVYRGMSMTEWSQAQERGYIQSDGRGVIADWEGTNAGLDAGTARSYLPGTGEPSVIVRMRVDPKDGWFAIPHDGYLRTREPIPLDRVEGVSDPMRMAVDPESRYGRRRLERYHGDAEQKDLVRTLGGERRFHLPIGAEIRRDQTVRSGPRAMGATSGRLTDVPIGHDENLGGERRLFTEHPRLHLDGKPGWSRKLHTTIEHALHHYRMWTFRPVNAYLRDNGPQQVERGHGRYDMLMHTVHMDTALAASPLRHPIITYRGGSVPGQMADDVFAPNDSLIGHEWTDPGFISTSPDAGIASAFGAHDIRNTSVVMRLHVPAGTGAIQLQSLPNPEKHWLRKNDEGEILLERNLTFRVTGDTMEQFGTTRKWHDDTATYSEEPYYRRVLDVEVTRHPEHFEDETKGEPDILEYKVAGVRICRTPHHWLLPGGHGYVMPGQPIPPGATRATGKDHIRLGKLGIGPQASKPEVRSPVPGRKLPAPRVAKRVPAAPRIDPKNPTAAIPWQRHAPGHDPHENIGEGQANKRHQVDTALDNYLGAGRAGIDAYMRGEYTPADKADTAFAETAHRIQTAMEQSKLPQETQFWRAMDPADMGARFSESDSMQGMAWDEDSFSLVSGNQAAAGNKAKVLVRVTAPAGTGALGLTQDDSQMALLQSGLHYEVTQDYGIGQSGARELEVTVTANAPKPRVKPKPAPKDVSFSEQDAKKYGSAKLTKIAKKVTGPGELDAEWGERQKFSGDHYVVYNDQGVPVYGSAAKEWEDMHSPVAGTENGWQKHATVDAHQYHGPDGKHTTVMKDGTVETQKDIKAGDWIVRQKNGETQVLSNEEFRKRYDSENPQDLASAKSSEKSRTAQPPGYPKRATTPPGTTWPASPNGKLQGYNPPEYTAPAVANADVSKAPKVRGQKPDPRKYWADPADPKKVTRKFTSAEGPVKVDAKGRPLNPTGPTGIQGRGSLGKWGRNPAADAIITRHNPETGELEMASIKRPTGEWAIPGGMVDDGELAPAAMMREFEEETGAKLNMRGAKKIYKGYVDDPRNTDNAWMETTASHLHLSPAKAAQVHFTDSSVKAGETTDIRWQPVTDDFVKNLYASHGDFVREAIKDLPRKVEPKAKREHGEKKSIQFGGMTFTQ
jgi:ADP-ribose pyrophosphatase